MDYFNFGYIDFRWVQAFICEYEKANNCRCTGKVMEKVMEKTMNYIDRRVEKEMRSIESYTVLRMDMIEEKNKNKRNGGK